jgi:hypothetical protein
MPSCTTTTKVFSSLTLSRVQRGVRVTTDTELKTVSVITASCARASRVETGIADAASAFTSTLASKTRGGIYPAIAYSPGQLFNDSSHIAARRRAPFGTRVQGFDRDVPSIERRAGSMLQLLGMRLRVARSCSDDLQVGPVTALGSVLHMPRPETLSDLKAASDCEELIPFVSRVGRDVPSAALSDRDMGLTV